MLISDEIDLRKLVSVYSTLTKDAAEQNGRITELSLLLIELTDSVHAQEHIAILKERDVYICTKWNGHRHNGQRET